MKKKTKNLDLLVQRMSKTLKSAHSGFHIGGCAACTTEAIIGLQRLHFGSWNPKFDTKNVRKKLIFEIEEFVKKEI